MLNGSSLNEKALILEIPYECPMNRFECFKNDVGAILLHSSLNDETVGRYSYIASQPFQTLIAKNGVVTLNEKPCTGAPFDVLKQLLLRYTQAPIKSIPPFQGGAAGAFSYDLHQCIEPISIIPSDPMDFPDAAIGFYDAILSFDHTHQRSWIVSTGWPEHDKTNRLTRAKRRLRELENRINSSKNEPSREQAITLCDPTQIESPFDATTYKNAVDRIIAYIKAGDIFQANLSQCFRTQNPSIEPFELYKRLVKKNPAPFAAYLNLGTFVIVSASPERFLTLNHKRLIETRPIKGTRRRDTNPNQDQLLANELINSEKDRSENIMIVDLMRNDLSKVCKPHSIHVTQLCALETYPSVHHLVSVVVGELRLNCDAIDLLKATFPGGSVTGAPKIRAMEIISEIEPTKRGMYCGSIGFIGFNGAMDLSIAIRTMTISNDWITFQAGGAIVADSDPEDEYQETLIKSRALHRALTSLD